jgi:hypothetical protein
MIATGLSFALITALRLLMRQVRRAANLRIRRDCVPRDLNPDVSEGRVHPKTNACSLVSSQLGAGHEPAAGPVDRVGDGVAWVAGARSPACTCTCWSSSTASPGWIIPANPALRLVGNSPTSCMPIASAVLSSEHGSVGGHDLAHLPNWLRLACFAEAAADLVFPMRRCESGQAHAGTSGHDRQTAATRCAEAWSSSDRWCCPKVAGQGLGACSASILMFAVVSGTLPERAGAGDQSSQ